MGEPTRAVSNAARAALDAATKCFAMNEGARAAVEKARATCASAVSALRELKWEHVPQAAVGHIKAHPYLTAMQASSILVAFVPGLAWIPAATGLGFGTGGPTAGYLAPAFQSAFGTPTYFSALQSAAMNGWGVSVVNGAVQVSAIATGIMSEVAKHCSSKL
ncbi:Hypothetical predicted protein [Lecanosticta acicola]|uniref:Uncharacterized protein n=1 Tax=Lecanosticta acicola TaxID=111012 RepID=A0AAI9EB59_9PEZI|nr:Hypothetical predicted protein [Lecanosticta acicola]